MKNRKNKLLLILGCVLLLLIIGGAYYLGTQNAKNSIASNSSSELITITRHGGLCPDSKMCQTIIQITNDGTVLVDQEKKKVLTPSEMTTIKDLISNTDFAVIKSKPFTGTCPIAYDGQKTIYNFQTVTGSEIIDSCEIEIDYNEPLFKTINQITSTL